MNPSNTRLDLELDPALPLAEDDGKNWTDHRATAQALRAQRQEFERTTPFRRPDDLRPRLHPGRA